METLLLALRGMNCQSDCSESHQMLGTARLLLRRRAVKQSIFETHYKVKPSARCLHCLQNYKKKRKREKKQNWAT